MTALEISSPSETEPEAPGMDLLLRVRNLCKHFPVFSRGFFKKQIATIRAVDQVSFDLKRGETLGLVGESV